MPPARAPLDSFLLALALQWVLVSLFAKCWMTRLTAAARLDAVNF